MRGREVDVPEAMVERRTVRHCGLYGIGLKIDVLCPHEVLKVIDLRDAYGDPAPPGAVNVSDVLLSVNGKSVENVCSKYCLPLFVPSNRTPSRLPHAVRHD